MSSTPDYFNRYENLALTRSESGVLTLRFHTSGGPATFTGTTHSDLPRLLEEIAFDCDNKALVITGMQCNAPAAHLAYLPQSG